MDVNDLKYRTKSGESFSFLKIEPPRVFHNSEQEIVDSFQKDDDNIDQVMKDVISHNFKFELYKQFQRNICNTVHELHLPKRIITKFEILYM